MAKLKDNDIKKKVKAKFNEYEIYNPEFNKEIYNKISQMIKDNSVAVMQNDLLEVFSDIKINNMPMIIKEMLKYLTNIEEDFDNKTEEELDNIFTLADGDFKNVIQTLMDMTIDIGHDNRVEEIMKLKELNNKLIEFKQSLKVGIDLQQTLLEYGLDADKLIKLKDGDENILQEFQEHIIKDLEKEIKPKRQYNRKKK
jgi:hypothetical protein